MLLQNEHKLSREILTEIDEVDSELHFSDLDGSLIVADVLDVLPRELTPQEEEKHIDHGLDVILAAKFVALVRSQGRVPGGSYKRFVIVKRADSLLKYNLTYMCRLAWSLKILLIPKSTK